MCPPKAKATAKWRQMGVRRVHEALGGIVVAKMLATTLASCAGHARRLACERRAAGWRVPAEPTMLRLNPHVFGVED